MASDYTIDGIFPVPVYSTHRDSGVDSTEKKEIENIIKGGRRIGQTTSINNYVFDTKLKKIKEFCEHHINVYGEKIIKPTKELDFYITQSWLNITKPGEFAYPHFHDNSIISGVFYVSTIENDNILFSDPFYKMEGLKLNNRTVCRFGVKDYQLIIFPSWLLHGVELNESAKGDRISIAFNTFVKGNVGERDNNTELFLRPNSYSLLT